MLDPRKIDFGMMLMALEDRSYESSSWIHPETGAIEFCSVDDDPEEFAERGLVQIEPLDGSESYEIIEGFVSGVRHRGARERLEDAIRGRGAFRRFRDIVYADPELGPRWNAFRDARMRDAALDWLVDRGLVTAEAAEAARAAGAAPEIDQIRAVLLDIDGVLTVSWEALPGAVEAYDALVAAGLRVALVTNTTSRTRTAIGDTLRGAGFAVGDEQIVTAPIATAAYLAEHHPGARCLLLSSGDVAADLAGVHLAGPEESEIDVVLVGGGGPELDYAALNRAFGALRDGAALVAMHRSLYWRTDAGLQLDAGAFVAALEAAADVEAVVVGKPARGLFEAALATLGAGAAEAVMVGDDLDSDVLAAQDLGLTGVLVRTGKFRPEALERSAGLPDAVLDSVADLPAWLRGPEG